MDDNPIFCTLCRAECSDRIENCTYYKPVCEDCETRVQKSSAKNLRNNHFIEAVNHPPHYQSKSGLEVIEVIEAFELDFNLGNAVKYILRAGKKCNEVEDLEKAMWYIQRRIYEISQS